MMIYMYDTMSFSSFDTLARTYFLKEFFYVKETLRVKELGIYCK